MTVGFDISQTGALKTGCGFWAHSLIEALSVEDTRNDYIVYPLFGTQLWDAEHATTTWNRARANVRRGPEGLSQSESLDLWHRATDEALGNPDVVHCNNYYCPHNLKARVVYTVYDLVALDAPDYITEANRLVCTNGLVDASIHADLVIAISDFTKTRFLDLFPHYPASRVRTVHPASRFSGSESGGALPDGLVAGEFWLTVGTIEPRKNLRRMTQAYAALTQEFPETGPLVIAGGRGWMEDDFDVFIRDLGVGPRVRRVGYVNEETLATLYRSCRAFVYPSLLEGFGLPVLEAMTFGAPVVTSNRSSLPETAGYAALTCDPEDVGALLSLLRNITIDAELRRCLSAKSRERARQFSWSQAAKATLDVYREAVARPSLAVAGADD